MTAHNSVPGLGYLAEHEYLHICGTCYQLYETGRPDGQEQRCGCQPRDVTTWPGADFNERARLCACCGMDVLHSGSRWSNYFCRECQLRAQAVSVWERRLVFPIGRHSMMHTWVPRTPAPTTTSPSDDVNPQVTAVHAAIQAVVSGSDVLQAWRAVVMPANLEHLGLAGGVSLRDYVAAAVKSEAVSRLRSFEGLCELYKRMSPPRPRVSISPADGAASTTVSPSPAESRPQVPHSPAVATRQTHSLEASLSRLLRDPLVLRVLRKELGKDAERVIQELRDGDDSNCDVELSDLVHNDGRLYLRRQAAGYCGNYHIDVRGLGGVYLIVAAEHDDEGYFHSVSDADDYIEDNWSDLLRGIGRQFRAPFDPETGWRGEFRPSSRRRR